MKTSILILSILLLVSNPVRASQERAETFSSFSIEASAASVHGKQSQAGVEALRIDAFGRTFTLSKKQLRALDGLIVNGIQVSSDAGYPGMGGQSIYIRLSLGFTSGELAHKYVVVSEENGVQVRDTP